MKKRVLDHINSIESDVTLLLKYKRLETEIRPRKEGEPITKEEILFAVNCIRKHCDIIEKECE